MRGGREGQIVTDSENSLGGKTLKARVERVGKSERSITEENEDLTSKQLYLADQNRDIRKKGECRNV